MEMKSKTYRPVLVLLLFSVLSSTTQAQILNKLKRKVENAATKPSDKPAENKEQTGATETKETNNAPASGTNETATVNPVAASGPAGESDFIPGSTVLYFDNFANDRTGESPAGWLTTSSAEVVTVDGLKGKWLKLAAVSSNHITRNKKQS